MRSARFCSNSRNKAVKSEGIRVALLLQLLAIGANSQQQHVLFPPNDEYHYFDFHPDSITSKYDFPPIWSAAPLGGYSRACSSRLSKLPLRLVGGAQFNDQQMNDSDANPEYYFQIHDGEGRLFACKVHHQDDLRQTSLYDSVFDEAVTVATLYNDKKGQTPFESTATTSQKKSVSSNAIDSELPGYERKEDKSDDLWIKIEKELSGVCTQFHTGYWSYEWCYKDTFKQFHVSSSPAERPGFFLYTIESIISLGTYKSEARKILNTITANIGDNQRQQQLHLAMQGGGRLQIITNEQIIPKKEMILIQTFEDGAICDATGLPRTTTVNVRCCTEHEKKKLFLEEQTFFSSSKSANPSFKALILQVHEDSTNLCTYTADVCTPLLCLEDDDPMPASPSSITTTKESIRKLLQRSLDSICLSKTDGWWKYEFCHLKHARQFHVGAVLDPNTGVAAVQIEADHKLGLFVDQSSNTNDPSSAAEEDNEMNHMENERTLDAVFKMEYSNGDMCDNSPEDKVKDFTLKTVARSTTVKFSCGKNYELIRIEEDRTCHYVFHVTVPDLCRHEWFQVPVLKEQVIKCLPMPSDGF